NNDVDGTALGVESIGGLGVSSFSNSGTAVFGQSFSSTKPAGHFQIFNTNSNASALFAETNGKGEALEAKNTGGGTGVSGSGATGISGSGTSFGVSGISWSGVGVFGNSPSGTAGKFIAGVADANNPNPALHASTLGTGHAVIAKSGGKG